MAYSLLGDRLALLIDGLLNDVALLVHGALNGLPLLVSGRLTEHLSTGGKALCALASLIYCSFSSILRFLHNLPGLIAHLPNGALGSSLTLLLALLVSLAHLSSLVERACLACDFSASLG